MDLTGGRSLSTLAKAAAPGADPMTSQPPQTSFAGTPQCPGAGSSACDGEAVTQSPVCLFSDGDPELELRS